MSGCDAISPHTLTRCPPRAGDLARCGRWRSTAGCSGVKRAARFALPRSTASVYCIRSLVPMLKNALLARQAVGDDAPRPASRSSRRAARRRGTARRAAGVAAASSQQIARARAPRRRVTMSGSMSRMSPCTAAARSRARSWARNSSGWSRHMRIARQPRNGFGSAGAERGRELVAADVEGADHHRLAVERLATRR